MCGEAETLLQSLGTAGFSAGTVLVLGGTAEQGIVAHICKPSTHRSGKGLQKKKKKRKLGKRGEKKEDEDNVWVIYIGP